MSLIQRFFTQKDISFYCIQLALKSGPPQIVEFLANYQFFFCLLKPKQNVIFLSMFLIFMH